MPSSQNRCLARALAGRVPAGHVIPANLYLPVADLLLVVYGPKNRGICAQFRLALGLPGAHEIPPRGRGKPWVPTALR